MPNDLYWKGKKVGSITAYTSEYYILELDPSISVEDLQKMTDDLQQWKKYNGLFVFLYDEDQEIIKKFKKAGFHYDETLLEEALSRGEHYMCYSKYRPLSKILGKKHRNL